MAKQRLVNSRYWDDSYIVSLLPLEKLAFLYFLTNPLTNIAGAYEVTVQRISFDTGLSVSEVEQILSKFAADKKIIFRNDWVLIVNFKKHQATNPNIEKGVQEVIKTCPDWIKEFFKQGFQSLSKASGYLDLNLNSNLYLKEGDIVSDETPPPPPPPAKLKDERQTHPAVQVVYKITKRYPHKDLWDRLIREIGDKPDIEFLTKSFEKWRSFDGNPMSLEKWLFEPYRTRKLPEAFGEKNGKSKETNWQTVGKSDEEIPEVVEELLEINPIDPNISPEENQKWQSILTNINGKLRAEVFESWFKPIKFQGIDVESKTIKLYSTEVNKNWVIEYYSKTLCQALEATGLGEYTFDWKIEKLKFEVMD